MGADRLSRIPFTDVLPDVGHTIPTPDSAEPAHPTDGYGTDPNVVTPQSPWVRTLTEYQRHVLAALADIILPGIDGRDAPSEVGIADFFDEWLSAPYDQQMSDRKTIISGIEQIVGLAKSEFDSDFLDLATAEQGRLLSTLASEGDPGRIFFVNLRSLVLGGYYTTDIGLRHIGYTGNVPLGAQPKITREGLVALERAIVQLGLK